MTTTSRSDDPIFNDLMVDIETMSTHPSNALILSIGVAQFQVTEKVCFIGECWRWRPRLEPQLLQGREVTKDAQKFWAGQPPSAQRDWVEGPRQSAGEIWNEITALVRAPEVKRVWARGDIFDMGNLVTYFRDSGFVEPWEYNAPRDSRTFCEETVRRRDSAVIDRSDVLKVWERGAMSVGVDVHKLVPHTPISDCINQAFDIWRHRDFEALHIPHHPV